MKIKRFNKIIERRIGKIRAILTAKAEDYAKGADRLYTFNRGAQIIQKTPAEALDGMLIKHYISYREILDDVAAGKPIKKARLDEKMGDLINYLLIQEAVILDSGLVEK